MVPVLAVTVGLLLQAGGAPQPVRVWRTDSVAFVALSRPGHLLVMHVDAIGRIQVLYPLTPDDSFIVSNDAPAAIPIPPTAEGNPATFIAVRSRWAFDFASVQLGSWWDYQNALLLQPTAGDPLAALLEIADRVTDGRPYDYAEATYSREGVVIARGPVEAPQVCWTCVRPRPTVVAAAAPATNSVDCTNATLTNSFCGVASAPVTIASAPPPAPPAATQQPAAVPTTYYAYPYYFWSTRGAGFDRPMNPPPIVPRSQGVASPIAPRVVVPSGAAVRGRPR
ncbi:MAG TPA: hypothetical protein VN803_12565 [Gemmatimonadales bacterium]|nr:hypothetical protein [Gemmatimonadales bacterium]